MTSLGHLLSEAAQAAKKKPASSGVTIKISGGGAAAAVAGDKKKKSAKKSSAQKTTGKTMRDLLAHHDAASIYHRQKSAEHSEWHAFHNKDREARHLGPMHKQIATKHDELRGLYHRLGNATHNQMKRATEPKAGKTGKKPVAKSKKSAKR